MFIKTSSSETSLEMSAKWFHQLNDLQNIIVLI